MKKFKVLLIVMLSIIIIGCNNSKFDNTNTDKKDVSKTSEKSQTSNNIEKSIKDENKKNDNDSKGSVDESKGSGKDSTENKEIAKSKDSTENSTENKDSAKSKGQADSSIDSSNQKDSYSDNELKEKVIDYIINGQGDKPDADKIKWSEQFLNKVDIDSLYKQYIANDGTPDDLKNFSLYITLNAPIPSDWGKMFEADLYKTYGQKVVRLEHLEDALYQAYIIYEGKEIPYVVVSSRTGYFHG